MEDTGIQTLSRQRIAFVSVHGCPLARLGARSTGGMNVYIRHLAEGLGRLGFQVDVFTRAHGHGEPEIVELDETTRVIHLEAGPTDAPKEDLFGYLPSFVSQLNSFRESHDLAYGLLHTHYWLSGWVGEALSRQWGIPHVTTFHTLAEIKTRARIGELEATPRSATERQVAAAVDRIVVSTAHERGALQQLYDVSEAKVRVVPGGVDLEVFQPGDQRVARDSVGVNGDHTLLYVGRLDPIKGLDVLMYSVAAVEASREVRLLVVGGGGDDHAQEQRRLEQLADDLDIGDRVDFLGSLPHEMLPQYYRAADVCVVPSYYESFGLVALEAMACGTPVVASRVPGLQTIVRDNSSGYLVPWHCPDAFADRLEVLLANDLLRESMGREARSAATHMSWDGTANGVAQVYEELGVCSG